MISTSLEDRPLAGCTILECDIEISCEMRKFFAASAVSTNLNSHYTSSHLQTSNFQRYEMRDLRIAVGSLQSCAPYNVCKYDPPDAHLWFPCKYAPFKLGHTQYPHIVRHQVIFDLSLFCLNLCTALQLLFALWSISENYQQHCHSWRWNLL